MKRDEKTAAVAEMAETVAKAPHAFLIDYKGIKVPEVTELRRQIRGAGSEYVVVKNTLALRSLKDAPLGQLSGHFQGMTAVAYAKAVKTALAALPKGLRTLGRTNPS